MGPRRRRRGEQEAAALMEGAVQELQCGHGVAAVENYRRRARRWIEGIASMRPRRRRRGEQRLLLTISALRLLLQCGHGVAAVENHCPGKAGANVQRRLNAATAPPPWRTGALLVRDLQLHE